MTPDPKRTAQACRVYEALLRYYPISFQREYGGTLALQFKDEYCDVLANGEKFSLFRFWIFILFDFIHSLLAEVLEEVERMIKKNFFVFCAIAAGLATLLFLPFSSKGIFINDKVDMWMQLLTWPLFLGCGALALFGIAKLTGSHLIFRIFSLIVLVYAISALPIPSKDPVHGWVGRPAFTYLIANEDGIFGYDVVAYLILTLIIALAAFAKRKWLPGGCLLVMNLWLLIPNIAYTISEDSLILRTYMEQQLVSHWLHHPVYYCLVHHCLVDEERDCVR